MNAIAVVISEVNSKTNALAITSSDTKHLPVSKTSAVTESEPVGTPASEAVRACLQRVLAEDFAGKQRPAARKLKVSQAYISDSLNRKRSGIPKLAEALATYLRIPYEQVIGKSAAPRVDIDPRYPNRSRAIGMAVEGLGITPAHAERLAPVALDADEDPEVFWWLDQIRARHGAERKGVKLGVQEVSDDE